jgi:hypothetical protein
MRCHRQQLVIQLVALLCLWAHFSPAALWAESPRYTLTQAADETVVRIVAVQEQILSDDLLTALSAVADLDGQTLARWGGPVIALGVWVTKEYEGVGEPLLGAPLVVSKLKRSNPHQAPRRCAVLSVAPPFELSDVQGRIATTDQCP